MTSKNPINKIFDMAFGYINDYVNKRQDGQDFFELNPVSITLPRLSQVFEGYRLVQISDIHIGTWMNKERLAAVVDKINQLNPDLVAITGDFVSYEPANFEMDLVEELSELSANDGKVAILGNHDHWTDPEMIRAILRQSGITDLSNTICSVKRDGAMLHFAGVDDVLEDLDNLEHVLDQLPEEGSAILLAHEPDFAERSARSGRFDLQISGHTHGGQVNFPWIGPVVLPPRGRRYPLGRYQINGMVQYTNRGLGTTYLQLRINCDPEITVFTLHSNNHQA